MYHRRHLEIAKDRGNKAGLAWALGNLGAVYEVVGRYAEAVECFGQHVEAAESMGDKVSAAQAQENLTRARDSMKTGVARRQVALVGNMEAQAPRALKKNTVKGTLSRAFKKNRRSRMSVLAAAGPLAADGAHGIELTNRGEAAAASSGVDSDTGIENPARAMAKASGETTDSDPAAFLSPATRRKRGAKAIKSSIRRISRMFHKVCRRGPEFVGAWSVFAETLPAHHLDHIPQRHAVLGVSQHTAEAFWHTPGCDDILRCHDGRPKWLRCTSIRDDNSGDRRRSTGATEAKSTTLFRI